MTADASYDPKQPSASRDTILGAAEELLSANGYAGTSISMICRRTGLRASSIYWHFGSKEGLLDQVLERAAERVLASLLSAELASARPQQRLEELFLACLAVPGSERAVAFRVLTQQMKVALAHQDALPDTAFTEALDAALPPIGS